MDKAGILWIIVVLLIALGGGYLLYGSGQTNSTTPTTSKAQETTKDTTLTNNPTTHMDTAQNGGLTIEVLTQGQGVASKNGDMITVDYTGMLPDGKVFDSSVGRAPFTLTLGRGQVIKGWEEGLLGMKVGEKRKLTIPPELAYGKDGFPGAIPPNATLIFDVELKAIK